MADTARKSPRCKSAGSLVYGTPPGTIIDCPTCGRPMRTMSSAQSRRSRIPSHGSIETRGTKAADLRMRHMQQLGL